MKENEPKDVPKTGKRTRITSGKVKPKRTTSVKQDATVTVTTSETGKPKRTSTRKMSKSEVQTTVQTAKQTVDAVIQILEDSEFIDLTDNHIETMDIAIESKISFDLIDNTPTLKLYRLLYLHSRLKSLSRDSFAKIYKLLYDTTNNVHIVKIIDTSNKNKPFTCHVRIDTRIDYYLWKAQAFLKKCAYWWV